MSDRPETTTTTSKSAVPAPYWVEVFWRLTPDWVQNRIDRLRRFWLVLKYHFRTEVREGEYWGCKRTDPCWCDLYQSKHGATVHPHCRHCTNVSVQCRYCGVNWLGSVDPLQSTPPWSYVGFGKWRCNQCRK